MLAVGVHPAQVADRDGAYLLLAGLAERLPRLAKVWVDAADQRPCATWITATLGWAGEVVRAPSGPDLDRPGQEPPSRPAGFQALSRHWVVQRTFAWLGWQLRLSFDNETLPETEEAWIYLAMPRLMIVRLVR